MRGHEVVCTVDPYAKDASCVTAVSEEMLKAIGDSGAEGIIEFSHPASVTNNIFSLVPTGIPLVVGTTGWVDRLEEVRRLVDDTRTAFLYSSNFSVGVNLFYKMVSEAARLMAEFEEYDVAVFESHHNQKADSPSGTGLDIARELWRIFPERPPCSPIRLRRPEPSELHLASVRVIRSRNSHRISTQRPIRSS